MTTTVQTEFSVYEFDLPGCQVRRLSGTNDPTPSQGEDGVWKPYEYLSLRNDCVVIGWPDAKVTVTSKISDPAALKAIKAVT